MILTKVINVHADFVFGVPGFKLVNIQIEVKIGS